MPPPRSGAADKKRKAVKPDSPGDEDLTHSSLEKRLELARAQRSRVLASRPPRADSASRTPPLAFVPQADPVPLAPSAEPAAEAPAEPEQTERPVATPVSALSPAETTPSDTAPLPLVAPTGPAWGRIGLVASGCSIGLALGLALGASLATVPEPLATLPSDIPPQDAALASAAGLDEAAPPGFELTGITELAAALPPPTARPDPVATAAVPVAPSAAPPSDPAPRLPVTASFSAFWDLSEPRAPDEIPAIPTGWSVLPPPEQREPPKAPGRFDSRAQLAPFEAAPVPPFSLAEDLFAPGNDLPATKIFVFAPAALSAAEVDAQIAVLAETGLTTANLQRIEMTISAAHLRYYTASDGTVAMALAEKLGVEARDFTGTVAGQQGHIEVWLAGRSGLPAAPARTENANDTRIFGKIVDLFKRAP